MRMTWPHHRAATSPRGGGARRVLLCLHLGTLEGRRGLRCLWKLLRLTRGTRRRHPDEQPGLGPLGAEVNRQRRDILGQIGEAGHEDRVLVLADTPGD